MAQYGYIRVSAKDQNPERQMIALKQQKIKEKNIYTDKISGQNFDRPEYIRLMKRLKKGDLIVVKSIDRLGRNYEEVLEQWRIITKEKGVDIHVIDMPMLNTDVSHDNLTGLFVSNIVLQILAYFSETERQNIRQRQAEGISAAKLRGVKFGRRKSELPDDFEKYYQLWCEGKITLRAAAEELNINHVTFYRRCKERREKD